MKKSMNAKNAAGDIDWKVIDGLTDEQIAEQIKLNPDAGAVWTEAMFKSARIVRPPDRVDVKAIRSEFGLTQAQFAARFGFSKRTLEKWEQGDRIPEGPARTLLLIIRDHPEVVEAVLAGGEAA